ncbi:MAG: Asp-tRNA(Asn)/Glu-tRNA(Gln) amidotransferase subunit GatB [Magnetococcales bacterium]|nr:Asp-tRNA(Asn)/Glu-tRNA(Gln) amidotransferase subunit GatB [Magnetococcales bacterium]MBF0156937.1 Asp-tRNA(Asn)/Glu-tRNA(Gln) amidotransferase subunit GatB [Magnetococcales bacterium]
MKNPLEPWEMVIGLEVHAQMRTRSKIFCACSTRFGAEPNTQICPVCAAFPGVLPVLNREVVTLAIKTGLGLQGEIRGHSEFSRKNYFYPDLPAGYQITQYEWPIVLGGQVAINTADGRSRRIGLTRIHLEVDAGKSLHEGISGASWIDLNRTGTPLMEIVSEPDLRSSEEAGEFLKKLRAILRYLEVCDGNMEEGSLRCDANVSVRRGPEAPFGTRCELKNLNSIRNVMRAIDHEAERQIEILESGGRIDQETRLWDADRGVTRTMRDKEDAHDYRYFPEPDLPPLVVDAARIAAVAATLPELPDARLDRFRTEYGLSDYDAGVLTMSRELADYFEECLREVTRGDRGDAKREENSAERERHGAGKDQGGSREGQGDTRESQGNAKVVANWVSVELLARLNRDGVEITASPVPAARLGRLLALLAGGSISGKIAKEVFDIMFRSGEDPEAIVAARGLNQLSDVAALEKEVLQVLEANPREVAAYRAGKSKLLGFFVGQVMRATRGKANPELLNRILLEKL